MCEYTGYQWIKIDYDQSFIKKWTYFAYLIIINSSRGIILPIEIPSVKQNWIQHLHLQVNINNILGNLWLYSKHPGFVVDLFLFSTCLVAQK